jgi:hypothetical protein
MVVCKRQQGQGGRLWWQHVRVGRDTAVEDTLYREDEGEDRHPRGSSRGGRHYRLDRSRGLWQQRRLECILECLLDRKQVRGSPIRYTPNRRHGSLSLHSRTSPGS